MALRVNGKIQPDVILKNKTIPFSKVSIGQEEIDAVTRVMQSGWLAAGPETAAFEREFSLYITPEDVKPYYCIFTNSCTSALKMAYKIAKEQGFDYFKCQDNTFCATYSAGIEMGLKILDWIYDRDKPFSPYPIEPPFAKVNVHYSSVKDTIPCLIEDSAHRIEPNDPLVGNIRCYSFYATKNMTTNGAGGMFVTNDKDIYERARLYWRDGLSTSTADRLQGKGSRYHYDVLTSAGGYDGTDVAAAVGRVQLKKLPEFTRRRNEIVRRYNEAFGQDWRGNHLYCVEANDKVEQMLDFMDSKGIKCGYHYPHTGWTKVSLPLYPSLADEEVEYIIQAVKEWHVSLR